MALVNNHVSTTLASTIANHQAQPVAVIREPQERADCALIMQTFSVADAFGEALIEVMKGLKTQEVTTLHG